ncbi:hypothetical protein ACKKBG_A29755 [Auxenochlorella protothecoides x Auxenochlorella symbiontica]
MAGGISSGTPGEASARSSIVTLINSSVGVGVLSLPYAFRAAGWVGGLALLAFVATVEAFTLYVLSRYAEHTDAVTYAIVVRRMLGPRASMFLAGVLMVYLFGSCVAYLIIFGDCLHPLVLGALGDHWFTHRNAVLPFFSAVLMFPLCLPRTLDAIVGVSAVALYGIVAMVGIVTYRNAGIIAVEPSPWAEVQPFNVSLDALAAVPIIIFGMQCHAQVITVFNELEERPRLVKNLFPSGLFRLRGSDEEEDGAQDAVVEGVADGTGAETESEAGPRQSGKSRKLRGMRRVVMAAIGLTAAGYSAIGLTGYLAFPHSAQSNILNNFSRRDGLMQLCRALVGLMKVVSYPINHHPARTCTQDVVAALTGHRPDSAAFNFAHAAGFYLATLAVALAVSDLGQVFKVVGGTNGAFLILGLPGALLMKYASDKALASRIPLVVEQPLLVARGEAPPPRPYRLLTSKLWWAGLGLVGLCVGVLALTIVSIVYPMQPGGE